MFDERARRAMLAAIEEAYREPERPAGAKERTRKRIERAATELFQRNGYRRTSIDDIARRAGVAKGTVYTHFKNKHELMIRAVTEEKRQLVGPFLEVIKDPSLEPSERLRRYLELLLLAIADAPLSRKLMLGDHEMMLVLEEAPPEEQASYAQMQAVMGEFLLAGVGAYDQLSPAARELRQKMLHILLLNSAALMDERLHLGLEREVVARELAHLLAAALGAP